MRWAVHWFESESLGALSRHSEHVLAVVLPVARPLPQCSAVQRRGDDLGEASPSVFTLRAEKRVSETP